MDKTEFCRKLESMLEMEVGSIQLQTRLDALEGWDSMSVITFIAMADSDYGATVPPKSIAGCETVGDLAEAVRAAKS